MRKPEVDTSWVDDQFERAGTPQNIREAILDLLTIWDSANIEAEQIKEAIDTFSELAQGHALLANESTEVWLEVQRGFVHLGDVIRVRADAFENAAGIYHNGRVGKVVGVRGGEVLFRSTDNILPAIDGARYSVDKLERRVS